MVISSEFTFNSDLKIVLVKSLILSRKMLGRGDSLGGRELH